MNRAVQIAFVATAVARPTNEQWQASQQAAADGKAAAAANASKQSAVDKVISMMENLQKQVLDEGEAEANTYNKFACFCKDTIQDKNSAIKSGNAKQADLTATLNDLHVARDDLDTEIAELEGKIETSAKEQKKLKQERKETFGIYTKNAADLQAALDGLDAAIKKLKVSKQPSLLQLKEVSNSMQKWMLMADVLGIADTKSHKVITAFLQQRPDVPMEDYKFHSGDIIKTLEELERKFRETKIGIDQEEVAAVSRFDSGMQTESDLTKQFNHQLDHAKKTREKTIEEIADNSEELSTTSAVLLDDQQYLDELSKMCSDKATTWDQRSRVRQDELSALTSAITIVKASVKEKTTSSTIRFAQQGVRVRLAEAVAGSPGAMEEVEAEAEDVESPTSFLQLKDVKSKTLLAHGRPLQEDGRDLVLSLLRSRGQQLHSSMLASLASRIAADPFAKVKLLIQELVDRLLKEAADETNQKAFCDKATKDSEQKRDYAAEEVDDLNSELAKEQARRDKLSEELGVLKKEIENLETTRNAAREVREAEKLENAHTVSEAEEGLEAVSNAIDILDKWYKTHAKEKVDLSLVQRGPTEDAPDAGFDNGEAYKGAEAESGGIIGMLEVIKSDFDRTIKETKKAEAEAEADHLAMETETGKSLAQKNMASTQKTSQRTDAIEKIQSAKDGLDSQTATLIGAIGELLKLKPICVDTGMSYEERVARREDEIESLKKALCILDAYAEYGPDGLSDAC